MVSRFESCSVQIEFKLSQCFSVQCDLVIFEHNVPFSPNYSRILSNSFYHLKPFDKIDIG